MQLVFRTELASFRKTVSVRMYSRLFTAFGLNMRRKSSTIVLLVLIQNDSTMMIVC